VQPFVEWIEDNPFYIRHSWDYEKGKWKGPGRLVLADFQRRILSHILTPDEDGEFPYSTIIYSCPKKSGKTAISAAIGAWGADQSDEGTEIFVVANDLEQGAGLIAGDVKYHAKKWNEAHEDEGQIKVKQYEILYPNMTFVRALAQSYKSSAGSRHKITLWDEIWGILTEDTRRMWEEMTPIPTVSGSLRFVSTYAGFMGESDLLWDIYLQGVGIEEHIDGKGENVEGFDDLPCWSNGSLFVYWDHEPRMPWQTDDYYDSQLDQLRPAAYLRLHENRWVTTHETFIPLEWWEEAEKAFPQSAEIWTDHPYAKYPVYIGIDAGIKRDTTAIVGVAYDNKEGKVIQLFHKIWTPIGGVELDLEGTLEEYIRMVCKQFNVVSIAYDPTFLRQIMQKLRRQGFPCEGFDQTTTNMTKASQSLFDTLRNKNYQTYPDSECKTHIQNAVAVEEGRGFRIVKDKRDKKIKQSPKAWKPIDFAIALAIAVYHAIGRGYVDVSKPLIIQSPFEDVTAWKKSTGEEKLPWMFRT
jgi:phage terminase large subunit-like protein